MWVDEQNQVQEQGPLPQSLTFHAQTTQFEQSSRAVPMFQTDEYHEISSTIQDLRTQTRQHRPHRQERQPLPKCATKVRVRQSHVR